MDNTGLWNLPDNLTFAKAFEDIDEEDLWQVGIRDGNIADELKKYLSAMQNLENKDEVKVHKLTINGGKNKLGEAENIQVEIFSGQVISIVGPTGSGKSRLLADIECLAQEDTPTKRQILIDDRILDDEARFNLEGKLVAQLSQNMNFIMDLSVKEFLEMHAQSRMIENSVEVIERIMQSANDLAGERFSPDTPVTGLSGGQSRALMIADTAILSASPIVLIDEIENAGIDREKALRLLVSEDKIVLMATHDPLLALMADHRIVIKNGGIHEVLETTEEEKELLKRLTKMDVAIQEIRQSLRRGNTLTSAQLL